MRVDPFFIVQLKPLFINGKLVFALKVNRGSIVIKKAKKDKKNEEKTETICIKWYLLVCA